MSLSLPCSCSATLHPPRLGAASPWRPSTAARPTSAAATAIRSPWSRASWPRCPYTGRCFSDRRETDIEHIVALSEAHDSWLCAADAATRRRFASDMLNLTLAGPDVNRNRKKHHDAAQWMPSMNRC